MVSNLFSGSYRRGRIGSTISGDGQRIVYEVHGEVGPSVVLIHGGSCDRSYWSQQIEALAEQYRVVAVDLLAHGESTGAREHWSIGALANDVLSVIAAEGCSNPVVVGHSMGGVVAIEVGNRLGERTAGIVVTDILHDPDLASVPIPSLPAEEGAYRAALSAGLARGMFSPKMKSPFQDQIIASMVTHPREIAFGLRAAFNQYDARQALKSAAVLPLMMIQSDLRPTQAQSIRRLHPSARIFVFKASGHFLMLERPRQFNVLLQAELLRMTGELCAI